MKIFSMKITVRGKEKVPVERGKRTTGSLAWIIAIIAVLSIVTIALAFYIDTYSQNKPADFTNLVTAISSIVLALITVITLIENRRISQTTIDIANRSLEETRLMRESQTEPKVFVRLHPREEYLNWIDMVIENVGPGAAHDVHFKISPQMDELMGTEVSKMGFVKSGFSCMASGQKFQFFLTDMAERPEEKVNACYTIDLDYKNSVGKSYHDTYSMDFSEMAGLTQLGTPPLHKISDALEKMQRDIDKLSTGWSRMEVIAYTPEDIKKEKEERLARHRAQKKGIEDAGNIPPQTPKEKKRFDASVQFSSD